MKSIAILALLVIGVYAAPSEYGQYEQPAVRKPIVPIVRLVHNDNNAGVYNLDVQSGDGQSQQEAGVLKDLGGAEGPVSVKTGSYSFAAPDGKTYSVQWKSDENGFQPSGEHLPTAPPMPEDIRKSVELNLQEERAGVVQH